MQVHKLITERWSPVAFSDKKIEKGDVLSLFEAARWAPSAFNAQPWKFIWGMKGDDTYPLLFELVNEGNQKWASTAPLLILSIAETIPEGRSSLNRFALYDTGMALGNLLLQATTLGIYVHQMGGYDHIRAKSRFKLPDSFEPLAMMALGFKGDPAILPKDIALRESKVRERKGVADFAFNTGF